MQKIFDKHELVTWYEGWFVPEKRHAEPAIALMAEQVAFWRSETRISANAMSEARVRVNC